MDDCKYLLFNLSGYFYLRAYHCRQFAGAEQIGRSPQAGAVFIRLSLASHIITRNLIWVIALYMPLWSYLNTQLAISRAGGDAQLGAWVDISVNSIVFLPVMLIFTYYTTLSPVAMFGLAKLSDFLKLLIARHQLKKERWVKNLTVV